MTKVNLNNENETKPDIFKEIFKSDTTFHFSLKYLNNFYSWHLSNFIAKVDTGK